ncbi:stonustoxin subunit alpha-like [Gouania willdenowi]|uniref:stonustoxin subunit alpha-like n=1 Tax=Gouania willdenowi TaxID=441366 RepID=UPI00105696DD|nr:stonustoxin subunit alpha-like [Gouania willdenowi]
MMSVSEGEDELHLQRAALSPLNMLRGDLNMFTEGVFSIFRNANNHQQQQEAELTLGALLRKDLNHLRDDLSSIFKVTQSKERRNLNAPRDNIRLLRQRCEENLSDTCSQSEEEEHEGTSVISLFNHGASTSTQEPSEGNLWNFKNLACYLTFDPNTANYELALSDRNRKATRVWTERSVQHHLERFQRCPQVLCREGLLDSAYWEVEWSGGVDVGVAYNSLSRAGSTENVLLGQNLLSWSLECSEGNYTPCHARRRLRSTSPQPFSRRVGVHLDREAESLSFYCVSRDSMTLLHTFSAAFCEPLYAAFWVWSYGGSVTLRQVELDWERLQ